MGAAEGSEGGQSRQPCPRSGLLDAAVVQRERKKKAIAVFGKKRGRCVKFKAKRFGGLKKFIELFPHFHH